MANQTGVTLIDRISRNNIDDQIHLGRIVENATKSEFGDLMRLIINGIVAEELAISKANPTIPSDRVLGRIEGLNQLQDKLILMIDIKNRLIEDKKEEQKV